MIKQFALILIFPTLLFADREIFQEKIATASLISNLKKTDNSLTVVSEKMIRDGFKEIEKDEILNSCNSKWVNLEIEPNKFRENYRDKNFCLDLKKSTFSEPFRSEEKKFENISDLNQWIKNFTQGKNTEGKKLYEFCPKSCSPSYRFSINVSDQKYSLVSSSTCGEARDKKDNNYKLTSYLACVDSL